MGIRRSPRPLRGEKFINDSGASRREVANVRLGVIATRWLAMTVSNSV